MFGRLDCTWPWLEFTGIVVVMVIDTDMRHALVAALSTARTFADRNQGRCGVSGA